MTNDRRDHDVVNAVLDMSRTVEESVNHGDKARAQLQATVEGIVAALRTDVHRAIVSLQIDQVDHRKAHEADRVERITRQQVLNIWMIAMTVLLLIGIGANIALFFYVFVTRG